MERVLAELATVVPGADLHDAWTAGRPDPDAHGGFDCAHIEAVDDDLVDRVHLRRQPAPAVSAKRGAVLLVRGRPERLVARADLAAAADDTAGEGEDDAGDGADGDHRSLCRVERRRLVRGQDEEVSAGNGALDAERVLAEELAVHHRHAPVAPAVELLAGLVPIPEETEQAPDLDGLLTGQEPVEARGGGTGHHALADAVDQGLAERGGVEAEDQETDSRPAVRRSRR